jgi:hypothetical protein
VDDETQLKNTLALMYCLNHVVLYNHQMDRLDFGLDALPDLQSLEINIFTVNRKLFRDLAKLRRLERLRFARSSVDDDVDVDVMCDTFTALPRLWFFCADKEVITLFDELRYSEKLRHAMQNITHFVVNFGVLSGSVDVIAEAIETISHLENVNRITVYFCRDSYLDPVDAHVAAAHAMARELRSASRRIDIIEFPL